MMRLFILILGGLQVLMFISTIMANLKSVKHTDLAGQGMAKGYAAIFGLGLFLFLMPALLLAIFNVWPWFALILLILGTIFTILTFIFL